MQVAIRFLACQIGKNADVSQMVKTRTPGNGGTGLVAGQVLDAFLLSNRAVGFFHWFPVGLKSLAA